MIRDLERCCCDGTLSPYTVPVKGVSAGLIRRGPSSRKRSSRLTLPLLICGELSATTRASKPSGVGESTLTLRKTESPTSDAASAANRPRSPISLLAPEIHNILSLQRVAGNRLVTQLLATLPEAPTIQRVVLKKLDAPKLKTPPGAIKDAIGLPANRLTLPGRPPVGDVERPKKVSAEVDKHSLRDGDRADAPILSQVTAMARSEQVILQGRARDKFFDAGHLIGDQLISQGDEMRSFTYWNLAPQISPFNTPAYSTFEGRVKAWAQRGHKVEVTVTVDYPDSGTYEVSAQHLVDNGVIPSDELAQPAQTTAAKPTRGKRSRSKGVDPATPIEIPRRIPDKWELNAVIQDYEPTGTHSKTSYPGKRVLDMSAATTPIGDPYAFAVQTRQKPASGQKGRKEKLIVGKQWVPKVGEIDRADVLSLIAGTFPALGNEADVQRLLAGEQMELSRKVSDLTMNLMMRMNTSLPTQISDDFIKVVLEDWFEYSGDKLSNRHAANLNTALNGYRELGEMMMADVRSRLGALLKVDLDEDRLLRLAELSDPVDAIVSYRASADSIARYIAQRLEEEDEDEVDLGDPQTKLSCAPEPAKKRYKPDDSNATGGQAVSVTITQTPSMDVIS